MIFRPFWSHGLEIIKKIQMGSQELCLNPWNSILIYLKVTATLLLIVLLGTILASTSSIENALATSDTMLIIEIEDKKYTMQYVITNGAVLSSEVDRLTNSLLIGIIPSGDGELIVHIPRFVMDSKESDNVESKDTPFVVLLHEGTTESSDITETTIAEVIETHPYEEGRTLQIDFTKETRMIEIKGTYLVPEFGPLIIPVASLSVAMTIVIARIRYASKL